MTLALGVFDVVLVVLLVWLAWGALNARELFAGVVLFICFGLVMALAWVRLAAPDVALAEAALGAGLTGALLLAALADSHPKEGNDAKDRETRGHGKSAAASIDPSARTLVAVGTSAVGTLLAWALFALDGRSDALANQVRDALALSGVKNPVTAVLLNFRSYDTLLELAVLLAALLGARAAGPCIAWTPPKPGRLLSGFVDIVLPIMLLVVAYLLWAGAHAPGGAFQAGAVLAGAIVLVLLARIDLMPAVSQHSGRLLITLGPFVFLSVALATVIAGGELLRYPENWAGELILLIESTATLSIGILLAALFAGGEFVAGPPGKRQST